MTVWYKHMMKGNHINIPLEREGVRGALLFSHVTLGGTTERVATE